MSDRVQLAASPAADATHSANPFEQYIDSVNKRLLADADCPIDARHGLRAYLWHINRILTDSTEDRIAKPK